MIQVALGSGNCALGSWYLVVIEGNRCREFCMPKWSMPNYQLLKHPFMESAIYCKAKQLAHFLFKLFLCITRQFVSTHLPSFKTSWILIGCFSGHCGRSSISRLITLSVNPGNSADIQTRWKTFTMKRLYCALFIIAFNHQVCAVTDTKPSKG